MEKAKEIKAAKARRRKMLDEFTRLNAKGWTQTKYAKHKGLTSSRVGQLLKLARSEMNPTAPTLPK